MTKRIMKKLAFLLSVVMVVSLFANLDFAVLATGGKVNITAENYQEYYEQDDAGEYCYSVSSEDVSSGDAYGTIYVPGERYHLIVENAAVTADTVILESGASLEILGDGALNFSGSGIQAADGALMMLQSRENKPSVITGLYDVFHNDETDEDEEFDIYADPGETEWEWMTFRYTVGESGEGKWYVLPGDGPEPGTLCVHYDNQDGGSVTWGEDVVNPDEPKSFIDEENSTEEQPSFKEINLTFHTPEDVDNTQIQVRVNGMDFYNNGETYAIEDEYLNELFGGSTASYFSTDESGNVKFTYSPVRDDAVDIEVIWLRPGGPQFTDNEYSVMYDPNGDASVTVNGELIGDRETKTFAVGDVLNFTLTPPDFRQGETPIVKIVVHDGDASTGTPETVWSSEFEEGNKITLTNNTFSFTPTSEKGFEVFIDWSEYDAFGGNDEYPVVVQLDCQGIIGFDGVLPENKINMNNFTKVRVAEDTASLTLTWEANAAPSQIKVEVNEQTQNEEERWLILDEEDFSNNSCSIPLTSLDENGNKKHFYYVCVEYSGNQGGGNNQYNFTRLQEELNGTYFAFGDINGDGTADIEDLKYGVMRPLYDDFRVNEGRYQREGAALGLKKDNKQGNADLEANMAKLLSLVSVAPTPISGDTITAKDKNGDPHTFNAYEVTITINQLYVGRENQNDEKLSDFPGAEEEPTTLDTPIILTTKAYLIDMTNSDEQVIIKVKDKYFVRDAYSDPANANDYDLEKFEDLNAWALILVADYEKKEDIVLFGNYARATETFSDETSDRFFASGFGSGETHNKYLGDKFIVMKPGFLGVTINGSGETKEPLAWSVTSSLSIAETGVNSVNNTETDIYFGFDSVEIAPITSGKVEGLGVTSISDVEVLDGIPENAVQVVETVPGSGKYTVQFNSDYYDTVRIKVTYNTSDGTQSGIMTLNRVGIMIQGGMTAGDSHTVNIFHGHDMGVTLDNNVYEEYKAANPDKTHGDYKYTYYATYYYPTDSNAASADTSLFVTYTYADGSVERKLLQSDYFTAATEENVAMSDYILYMGDGSNAPEKVEAIAIPNVNANGTINGAKLGAGKGVEGTFDIEFE